MILYDYNSNIILSKPLKTRQASELTTARTSLHDQLQSNGYAPELHILDNECSDELKKAFKKYSVGFQRVPPHVHQRNAAERAIQTWKYHFCSGLATCDPKLPLTELDLLMSQADITLNLLRPSYRQPNLSVYACLNGTFNFNQSPLAPPGTRVVVHITPAQRPNMGPHGGDGWYVGPSIKHYRCHKCYIPSTFGVCNTLTIDWFPHNVPFPKVTADESLCQTTNDMLTLIQDMTAHPIPSLTYGSNITNAYIQIAQILKRATAPPLPPPVPAPEPRVQLITPPAPEQRVHIPTPALPATIQKSSHPATNKKDTPAPRPSARFQLSRLGQRNTSYQQHTSTSHHPLAQCATHDRYAYHIAALATAPPTAGKQGSLTKLLRGPDATIWERSLANKWGRVLAHGLGISRPTAKQVKGTRTVFFIKKAQVPKEHRVTYANFICNIRPQKTETHRFRSMTAGGDKLDYPGDTSSPAISMLVAKLHINSPISDAKNGARYLGLAIKNFYLGTPMSYCQYIHVRPSIIPKEVWDDHRYNIPIADNGYIYLEIRRSMYGLKEAGIFAFNQLVKKLKATCRLRIHAFHPRPLAPSHEAHHVRSLH